MENTELFVSMYIFAKHWCDAILIEIFLLKRHKYDITRCIKTLDDLGQIETWKMTSRLYEKCLYRRVKLKGTENEEPEWKIYNDEICYNMWWWLNSFPIEQILSLQKRRGNGKQIKEISSLHPQLKPSELPSFICTCFS